MRSTFDCQHRFLWCWRDVGEKVVLVTLWIILITYHTVWFIHITNDGDSFEMLVADSLCWWLFRWKKSVTNISKLVINKSRLKQPSPTWMLPTVVCTKAKDFSSKDIWIFPIDFDQNRFFGKYFVLVFLKLALYFIGYIWKINFRWKWGWWGLMGTQGVSWEYGVYNM